MNPTLRFQMYDDWKDAVETARKNLFYEGAGHSMQIWTYDQTEIDYAAFRSPVVRLLVRQGGDGVANLTNVNNTPVSTSVGCGTWGGNNISENIDYSTLQNKTRVLYPLRAPSIPDPKVLFAKFMSGD
jgi:hypothetical protein